MTISYDRDQLTGDWPNDLTLESHVQVDFSIEELFMMMNDMGQTNGVDTQAKIWDDWGVNIYNGSTNAAHSQHYDMYEQLDNFIQSLGFVYKDKVYSKED